MNAAGRERRFTVHRVSEDPDSGTSVAGPSSPLHHQDSGGPGMASGVCLLTPPGGFSGWGNSPLCFAISPSLVNFIFHLLMIIFQTFQPKVFDDLTEDCELLNTAILCELNLNDTE